MKRLRVSIVLCIAVLGVVVAGNTENKKRLTKESVERIERDLIRAFESDIPGLQASAALALIQVKNEVPEYTWSRSIIPLMHIANDENKDAGVRIAAALALYELRTDRGDFLIARNARFTSDARVKHFCSLLAANRQLEKAAP